MKPTFLIDVRRDYTGLRIAAAELYVESFVAKDLEDVLRGCVVERPEGALEAVAKMSPKRSVAEGYYLWALYLLWLRGVMRLPGAALTYYADEAEGLLVLEAAEMEFRREHPTHACGELNHKLSGYCRGCGAELND